MDNYRLVPLISAEEVLKAVDRLAAKIDRDYRERDLVLIGILKGSFIFLADLVRRLTVPVHIDFVRLSSYGNKAETSGAIRLSHQAELPLTGRDVLIVEDIVDTGLTMRYLLDQIRVHEPRSLRVCALIDKHERRQVPFDADYVGIQLEKGFVVGYGLDYSERHRNLPGIFEVQFH
jgi:hypoxanthine phosphoribosyltransferase